MAVHALPELGCSQAFCSWPEWRGVREALVPWLWVAARVSSGTLWVSSTSPTFAAASACAVDARAGLAAFQQGFPVSPQETVKICSSSLSSPVPLHPRAIWQVFVSSRPGLTSVLIFSLQCWLLPECPSSTQSPQVREEGELGMACGTSIV